ncbi:DUF4232 domain-containing protein [Nonomuraea aridisoli]|uniref:DUF4232 domain-containing protein n=1 Tax=Nonomuraea aridisoli TaxID=2070368 RepID=A0A2W2EYR0_9ACTN|nr:DUF4232 domain-containing protein [Nonomuraea aridisoli]PZG17658.1 hypothetical protein C1J01_17475 [Nonomuraea aridisoli]
MSRLRTAPKAVLLLAVMAGLSACGSSSTAAPAAETPPAASSPAAAPSSAVATPAESDTSSAPAAGAPACAAGDVEVTLTEQPQRREGDTRMALLHVMNHSDGTCSVAGWPVVTLVNAADEAVEVPTENVAQPGESVPADLSAGGGAFAGIKWTVCDKSDSDCPTGNGFKVGLAADGPQVAATLEGFPAPEQSGITVKSLQVGTLQPSNQGVVAW